MILLSLIAVGLLSLSSSVLRSSQNSSAMLEARANARLALNMAIGELQKQAGPDTRITARADVISGSETVTNPYLTGVWESWYMDPSGSLSANDFTAEEKEAKLLSWLASGAPAEDEISNAFVQSPIENAVTLWDSGSLGNQATDDEKVQAALVTLSEEQGAGGYAWAVLDEGVKARVNTLFKPRNESDAEKLTQLGGGVRPAIESIQGLEGFQAESFRSSSEDNPDQLPAAAQTLANGVTFGNFALAAEQLANIDSDTLKARYHDLSLFSTGILTDTARGGLKTDFSLFSSQGTIPQIYSHLAEDEISLNSGESVYNTLFGLSDVNSSSPKWNTLFEFARLHEDGVLEEDDAPMVVAAVPDDWEATARQGRGRSAGVGANPEAPEELLLMPTVASVQMVFSLVGRELWRQPSFGVNDAPPRVRNTAAGDRLHGPQDNFFRDTAYHYDLQLMYTPVVVLHNPYNVSLAFSDMSLDFHHIPFAMQVFRNDIPQSTGLVPFENMFFDNDGGGSNKTFGMSLKTEIRGRPGGSDFTMLPGEVILFSPYIDTRTNYYSNWDDNDGRKTWDFFAVENDGSSDGSITADLEAIPGWRGDGLGFSCDWLQGSQRASPQTDPSVGRWRSAIGLATTDNIHVLMAPFTDDSSDSKFLVTMSAIPEGSRDKKAVTAIEIDYGSPDNLREKTLGAANATARFPEEGTVQGNTLIDWAGTTVNQMRNVTPIAIVSLQAKATYGGETPESASQVDGRIAAKPFAFSHGSVGASIGDVESEHPAFHSHAIGMTPLTREGTLNVIEVGDGNRGNFITGHSSNNGRKFGVAYEIPLTPLQSLATLNGANPGGSSAYAPRFAAPIGNSWAHPILSTDTIQDTSASGDYQMYDHSFLMNVALYDRFYFSGISSQTGPFGDGESLDDKLTEFAEEGVLEDERLTLYQPDSSPTSELEDFATNPLAHEEIAGWQMMQGAFNVNSTSVNAWKALLSSTNAPDALMNGIAANDDTSTFTNLTKADDGSVRFSRFRVPVSNSFEQSGGEQAAYWLGPRDYTEAEIERLAENIVEQVKLRGPFLSLAEFVNRQLGSGALAEEGALQAAIDEAELNDELVTDANGGYEIPESRVSTYGFSNPEAAAGSSAQGAPSYLTQADILTVLGNAATARSDTFTVRGYGESRDNSGQLAATAYCEAVVQRFPEWLDSDDEVKVRPEELTSETNQKFGRRFRVVSFRWLSDDEV